MRKTEHYIPSLIQPTQMCTKVFYKFYFSFFLLPKFHMTVTACSYKKISSRKKQIIKAFVCYNYTFKSIIELHINNHQINN